MKPVRPKTVSSGLFSLPMLVTSPGEKNPLDFFLESFKFEDMSRLVTLATVMWSSEPFTFFAY